MPEAATTPVLNTSACIPYGYISLLHSTALGYLSSIYAPGQVMTYLALESTLALLYMWSHENYLYECAPIFAQDKGVCSISPVRVFPRDPASYAWVS